MNKYNLTIPHIRRSSHLSQPLKKAFSKPEKIAHIGIAVHSIEKSLPFYTEQLGLTLEKIEEVQSEHVKVAFIKIGESRIELLEPISERSAIDKFLKKKGEGIHHIALEVKDIEQRLRDLKTNGIRLINEEPKIGGNDAKVAFLHPKSTHGVLYELCEHTKEE